MRSSKALVVTGLLALAGTMGCMGQPVLSQQFGLLPGPSVSLLTQVYAANSPLSALASLLGGTSTTGTTGTSTTGTTGTSTTGSTTGNCTSGQVWVAALQVCIPSSLASQFGL
jgi:hypothetical protein